MTDTMSGTGDAGSGAPSSDSPGPVADGAVGAGAVETGASADGGSVPAVGGDARPGPAPSAGSAVPATVAGEYLFGGRKFRDQGHAEQFFRTQLGKVPGIEKRLAGLDQLEQENAELHRRLNLRNAEGGQGRPREATPAKPKGGWGQELIESGDLALINELAEQKGVGHALYAMAELMGERTQTLLDQTVEQRVGERIGAIEKRQEFGEHMGNVMTAVRKLAPEYPELDEKNDSPEAVEAREAILAIWRSLSPAEALGDPETSLDYAVHKYRRLNGTPAFAVPPGSNASTSARVALAAERAAGSQAVLDEGTPSKPRPSGVPRTAQEELADELGEVDRNVARGSSGMNLGVRRVS
ncbi:MAG TPA: hypothetical protein VMZ92_17410 [Planctomycetota bacterium]|nr:hypothetical protein [Planctomycetota bacterium]